MLVHVSYPYHAYLESRPKIKNSCCMEDVKTFCNIFVTDVHRESIPGFASNKTKEKTLFHISNMFIYLLLVAKFNQYWKKKKRFDCLLKLISKRTRKIRFFVLARPSYSIKKNQPNLFYETKTYKNEFLNVSAFQWYQIIIALNKIWFSHSGWSFLGIIQL